MNRQEILLLQLSEECNEVGQRVSKAIRFGLGEKQQGQELTNAERLTYELTDLLTIVSMLVEEGIIPDPIDDNARDIKRAKIEKYLKYSQSLDILKY